MKKAIVRVLPLFLMFFLLAGCFFKSSDELFTLPLPPDSYLALQKQIQSVLDKGAEYAAPLTGINTQPVQLIDIDGDNVEEAVVFFRFANKEKSLGIYIYRQTGDGYENISIIEGSGTAFHSVYYANTGGNAASELVIGWQMSANVYSLSVFSLSGNEPTEIMNTNYIKYTVNDMDNDKESEVVVFYAESSEQPVTARYFDYNGVNLEAQSIAQLSQGASANGTVRRGYLADMVPAIYVNSSLGDGGLVTDILAVRDGILTNITLDREMKISAGTLRYYTAGITDIDGDGCYEVPQPTALPAYPDSGSTETFWILSWWRYRIDGTADQVCITFHNYQDGWYLVLPEQWLGKLTVCRRDPVSGERTLVFATLHEPSKTEDFLTILQLTGANRADRSKLGNRFVLRAQSDVIYAAVFHEPESKDKPILEQEDLISRFHMIVTEWSNE